MRAAQALALIAHRAFVIPYDVQRIAKSCLCHRIIIRPEAKLAGVDEIGVVSSVLASVDVPVQ